MINQKEIEAVGKEEYALWRKTRDRINSIKAFMEANAVTHITRFEDAIEAGMNGDHEAMLDMFGPGGVVGKTKLTFRQEQMIPHYPKKAEGLTKRQKMQQEVDRYNKATMKQRRKNKKSMQKPMRNGGSIHQFKMETPSWSTGSKASKKPSNVKTYSKEEIAEINRKLRNGLEI